MLFSTPKCVPTFCVFMSGGHGTNLNINRKLSARLHKHAVSSRFIMERKLKVTTKIKEHGSDKIEIREMLMVITKEDNLELLVQMAYGSWYDIVEYTYEPIEIHVSERYCHQVSARFLENGC